MDIPCVHTAAIKREHLFLYARDVALIFRDEFRLKFPFAVSGNIYLEFSILAFESLWRMSISLVVSRQLPFLIFLISKCGIPSASISS